MLRRNAKGGVLLGLSAIFFFSLFWMSGLGFYNDSDQYVVMHIHREPGYPLFLFVLRQIFGGASLWAAAFFKQS